LGSSDVIESLIGKAKQRLESNGRRELNKSILLIPCMCGELTQDLVAEALATVSSPRCHQLGVRKCRRHPASETQTRVSPVLRLKSREQKSPTPLLIQDKDVLQPNRP